MSVIPIPFDFDTVENSKGCPHTERVMKHSCEHCASQLCYECVFEEVIGKRMGAVSTIDKSTSYSHAAFCASCFLKRTREPDYRIHFKGALQSDAVMKPIKPALFRITHEGIDFANIFFLIMTFVLVMGPVMYGLHMVAGKKAYGLYEADFNKACSIIDQIQRGK